MSGPPKNRMFSNETPAAVRIQDKHLEQRLDPICVSVMIQATDRVINLQRTVPGPRLDVLEVGAACPRGHWWTRRGGRCRRGVAAPHPHLHPVAVPAIHVLQQHAEHDPPCPGAYLHDLQWVTVLLWIAQTMHNRHGASRSSCGRWRQLRCRPYASCSSAHNMILHALAPTSMNYNGSLSFCGSRRRCMTGADGGRRWRGMNPKMMKTTETDQP